MRSSFTTVSSFLVVFLFHSNIFCQGSSSGGHRRSNKNVVHTATTTTTTTNEETITNEKQRLLLSEQQPQEIKEQEQQRRRLFNFWTLLFALPGHHCPPDHGPLSHIPRSEECRNNRNNNNNYDNNADYDRNGDFDYDSAVATYYNNANNALDYYDTENTSPIQNVGDLTDVKYYTYILLAVAGMASLVAMGAVIVGQRKPIHNYYTNEIAPDEHHGLSGAVNRRQRMFEDFMSMTLLSTGMMNNNKKKQEEVEVDEKGSVVPPTKNEEPDTSNLNNTFSSDFGSVHEYEMA